LVKLSDKSLKNRNRKSPVGSALSFLVPIVASTIFSAVFTFLTSGAFPQLQFVSIPQGGIATYAINAVIIGSLPFIGALIILFIIRKRGELVLKIFIGTAFLISGFAIFTVVFSSVLQIVLTGVQGDLVFTIAMVLSLALNIILVYVILRERVPQKAKNVAAVIYGGGIGTLLGTVLPLWTGLLAVALISAYDIYSVRSGPLKKIVKVSQEEKIPLPGLSYVSRDWEIGLGDLGIYSMLVSLALTQFNLIACIASMIGIIIGSLVTLQLLKKRELLPGLPITSLLGSIPIVIFLIFYH
jgi:hypothetical protein